MMILMRIPLMMSGIGVIGGKIKVDFGRDGMGCIVVEDRLALQLQKTYPKQYRALRIPKELSLAIVIVPEAVELTPLASDVPPPEYVPAPLPIAKPKRTRSPNGTRKGRKR